MTIAEASITTVDVKTTAIDHRTHSHAGFMDSLKIVQRNDTIACYTHRYEMLTPLERAAFEVEKYNDGLLFSA
jgi:hypothetical protein